jgi:hypothetical protein
MTWYSAHLETDGPAANDRMGELLDRLRELAPDSGPVVGGGDRRLAPGLGGALSVQANSPAEAAWSAMEIFTKAVDAAGLTVGSVVRADIMTEAYRERWLELEPDRLVGVAEIAEMLGVSKQRVGQLRDVKGFPSPAAVLAVGPIWRASSLERFVSEWSRRPGRPVASEERSGTRGKRGPRGLRQERRRVKRPVRADREAQQNRTS